MKNQFKFKDLNFEIASPCHEDWDQMTGDDKKRFCHSCEKNVHNLSSMSDQEISDLLSRPDNVCVRLYKRHDGTILTEDCPIGLEKVKSHLKRKQFIAAFFCLMTLIFSFQLKAGERALKGKVAISQEMPEIMGDVMIMGGLTAPPIPEPTPMPEPTPQIKKEKTEKDSKFWNKIWK